MSFGSRACLGVVTLIALVVGISTVGSPPTAMAQRGAGGLAMVTCVDMDAWEWAQSVYESDPATYAGLDPDGDGLACPELPHGGFAPAFWTDTLPNELEEGELLRVIDGDTFEIALDGVSNRVRIYRADTPETQNEQHCGGQEATDFVHWALSFNDHPDGRVYLERDETTRDQYGRELAYLWFEVDGQPYLLNHVLINNGWAEDVDYGDRKYDAQFREAAAFAQRHNLGVWGLCGGFEVPLTPDQPAPQPSGGGGEGMQVEPQQPTQPGQCDPSYPTVCIPPYPPDLDCGDIGHRRFQVLPPDPHGFDGDQDGIGCERS